MAKESGSPGQYIANSVTSADGTPIGYLESGSGPGVILVHGGMMTSNNFLRLAAALSHDYTVYVPDRRGRGMSGPHGSNYSLARECEDIMAIIDKTKAQNIFGLSSGAIVVMQTALALPESCKVALYEPPLAVNGSDSIKWVARYEQELAEGRLAAAMVTVIKGTDDSGLMTSLPRFVLTPVLKLAIRATGKAKPGEVSIKDLIPTIHYDAKLVEETKGKMGKFKNIKPEVLLLGGSKSQGYLKEALDALAVVLPHFSRVELRGTGHLAADNSGKPELVAAELKRFFGKA